ncbi:MAG: hypothetical protein JO147_06290 [Actinobacteria bacterium]|nr:hypothetical protein [Actinomycetota bacterium]
MLATRFGLWWPFANGPRRIGWERIDKAVWRDGVLTVTEADLIDDLLLVDRPPISIDLPTPRDLPPAIRKRVEGSVVESVLVALPGQQGIVRLAGRRVPGRDGVSWWARLEQGTPDTPVVRAAVEELLAPRRAQRLDP